MADLQDVVARLRTFVAARDWAQFHDPKNLAMAVASEAGELCGVFRWVANADADDFVRSPEHRPAVEDEVADVAICLLLLCDRAGISLPDAMLRKIDANERRYPVELARGKSEKPVVG